MPPRTRAGDRTARFRPGFGRLGDNRVMMMRTQTTAAVALNAVDMNEYDEANDVHLKSEAGTTYMLYLPVPGRKAPLSWDLTSMTMEELEITRKFFNEAFDLAEPVVRERDRVAADAFAEGDDSFARVYRAVPQFIVRERAQRTDSEGIHDRPDGDADGAGSDRGSSTGVRGVGDELADGEPGQGGSQDHDPAAD